MEIDWETTIFSEPETSMGLNLLWVLHLEGKVGGYSFDMIRTVPRSTLMHPESCSEIPNPT